MAITNDTAMRDVVIENRLRKPIQCGNPLFTNCLRVATYGGSRYLSPIEEGRLITAILTLRGTKNPGGLAQLRLLDTKVVDFNRMNEREQLDYIDNMWRLLCRPEPFTTPAANMWEPEEGTEPAHDKSLPTSLKPWKPEDQTVRLQRGATTNAWTKFQVGFRIEGKILEDGTDDLARIIRDGCQPLTHSRAQLLSVRGMRIDDTYVENRGNAFIWTSDRDIFNETGTCISRSIFGATAFPGRNTNSRVDHVRYHYLVCVDCAGLNGVDTEVCQYNLGKMDFFSPGEKAFAGIPGNKVLAWTPVMRMPGSKPDEGWGFKFLTCKWNWLQGASIPLKNYLNTELSAWRANVEYIAHPGYDFSRIG